MKNARGFIVQGRFLSGVAASALLTAFVGYVPAVAASNASEASQSSVEQIVVTAQKRSEQIQDVPVPVSVLTAAALTSNNQLLIRDYATSVPGLQISPAPSSGGQQEIAIRGITAGFNGNPTVGITIDDVPVGSSISYLGNVVPDIDPSNLERVEVLRGPQGTLYGASSMGGLVKFVLKEPSTSAFSGRIQADGNVVHNGSSAGYGLRASMNIPVTETVAVAVSAFGRHDPGYINNVISHKDGVNKGNAYGGLFSGLWKPSDNFSAKANIFYQDLKADGAYEVDIPNASFPGTLGLKDLQQNYIPGLGGYHRKAQLYSLTMNAEIAGITLTSVTADNIIDFSNTLDFTYALGDYFAQNYGAGGVKILNTGRTKKFTQELRGATPIGQHVDLLIGGFYNSERGVLTQDFSSVDPTTGAIVQTGIAYAPLPVNVTELAGFADLTVHLTDKFDVQFGGRESHIKVDKPSSVFTGPLVGGSAPQPALNSSANAFTYLVTPQLKISHDLMVYTRFASGYRAGGPNNTLPPSSPLYNPAVPTQYNPDKTYNYELGIKGSLFDRIISYDASLYYIDWKSIQVNVQDPISKGTYTTGGGSAKSEGVELSIQARPTTGMTLGAWLSYGKAALTEGFPAGSQIFGVKGDRLPYSSRFSGSVSLDQDVPISEAVTGFGGVTVAYQGKRFGTFLATPTRPIYPGFTKVDLRLGAKTERWTANIYVNNVTDKRGILGGGDGEAQPYAFIVTQPRTFGISVARTF